LVLPLLDWVQNRARSFFYPDGKKEWIGVYPVLNRLQ